jgi:hypothetical protein
MDLSSPEVVNPGWTAGLLDIIQRQQVRKERCRRGRNRCKLREIWMRSWI